jgi:hypothetical protein
MITNAAIARQILEFAGGPTVLFWLAAGSVVVLSALALLGVSKEQIYSCAPFFESHMLASVPRVLDERCSL